MKLNEMDMLLKQLKAKKIKEIELFKIAKNSILNGGSRIFSKGISLVISIILARTIGVAGSGQYAIAVTYAGTFFVILNFGLFSIVNREIAKDPLCASDYISNSLGLFVFFSIPVAVAVGILLKMVLALETSYLLMIGACVYCGLTSIFTLATNALEGLDRFDLECKATVIYNVLTLIAAFPALLIGKKIEYLVLAYVVIFLGMDIYLLSFINKKYCRVTLSLSKEKIKPMLNMSAPLILSSASEYINLKADIIILGYEKGDIDTGLYSNAVNIYQGISCIPQALVSAFTPSYAKTYHKDKSAAKKLFIKTLCYFLVLLGIIAFLVIALSKWLVVLLYGKNFAEAAMPLAVLGITLIPMELNRLFNNTLIGMEKQKVVGTSIFIGTIFNVVSNILLIPRYSFIAAAYTTLTTESIVAIIGLYYIIKAFRRRE